MSRARTGSAALLAGAIGLLAAGLAGGDDFTHIGDDELALEIEGRVADIERTNARIEGIVDALGAARQEVEAARIELTEIELELAARAELLYRLSHHGKALRYLLAADTATGFLKRLATLRSLVITALEERRRIGLALTEAEARVETLRRDQRQAEGLRAQLESAHRELIDEQQRRLAPTSPAWI